LTATATCHFYGYQLPRPGIVRIEIYNLLGQKVRTLVNEYKERGRYLIQWNSRNDVGELMANGMYIYQMQVNAFVDTKKLVLMR
jgi:flagellar hook assembly protein FlgD